MKIVYTYYDNPNSPTWSGYKTSYELASAVTLSMHMAKQNVENAEFHLVCNEFGYHVLCELYEIKFNTIDNCLDEHKELCDMAFAMAKIIAYARTPVPFIHIDNDVFLLQPVNLSEIKKYNFAFQNKEYFKTHPSYNNFVGQMLQDGCSIPKIFKSSETDYAYNCGIVYAGESSTMSLLKNIAITTLTENKDSKLFRTNVFINHMIEQLSIARIIKSRKQTAAVLVNADNNWEPFKEKSIAHLWGSAKAEDKYSIKIQELLRYNSIVVKKPSDAIINTPSIVVSSGVTQIENKQCVNALVISMKRNHNNRLKIFKSRFNFRMNLSVIEGVDGSQIKVPSYSKLKPGTYGCLMSHLKAIKFAKAKGYKNVLILEDDVKFVQMFQNHLTEAMKELPDDWDMLWLGGADQITPSPYSGRLRRMHSSWGAYGYILRDTVYDFFIDCMSQGTLASDDYFRRYHDVFNSYRTHKNYVLHAGNVSVRINTDNGVIIK